MNIECSTLVLRTINATSINANRTTATWRINMRACLGNLYDKYSRFKICLTSWGTGVSVAGFVAGDLITVVSMSGPRWENQSYDTVSNGLTQNAAIATLRFVNNGTALAEAKVMFCQEVLLTRRAFSEPLTLFLHRPWLMP